MSVALNTKHLSSFISEEEYAAIYPQVEAAHKQLEAKNVPGMLANITSLFGRDGVNVENLSNKSRGDYAYTMVDLGSKVGDNVIEDVRRTANVIRVRSLEW